MPYGVEGDFGKEEVLEEVLCLQSSRIEERWEERCGLTCICDICARASCCSCRTSHMAYICMLISWSLSSTESSIESSRRKKPRSSSWEVPFAACTAAAVAAEAASIGEYHATVAACMASGIPMPLFFREGFPPLAVLFSLFGFWSEDRFSLRYCILMWCAPSFKLWLCGVAVARFVGVPSASEPDLASARLLSHGLELRFLLLPFIFLSRVSCANFFRPRMKMYFTETCRRSRRCSGKSSSTSSNPDFESSCTSTTVKETAILLTTRSGFASSKWSSPQTMPGTRIVKFITREAVPPIIMYM
mmetsp:Transcript_64663/g.151580  ORF Transcript_64663/g.151580 Transcript_64663/m.151580 type:complete len:303 (+) Transcript_64663:141-1049(+)